MANDITPHAQFYYDNEERAHESIDYFMFMSRIHLGWEWEKALTQPSKRWQPPEFYEWLEVAKKNGISEQIYRKRTRNGYSYEYAATYILPSVKYAKYIPIASRNGISKDAFLKRVKNGMSPHEACTKRIEHPKHMKWVRIAEENGLSRDTFYWRMHKRKMTPKEAATTPKNSRNGHKQDLKYPDLTEQDDTLINLLLADMPVSRRLRAYYMQNQERINRIVEEKRNV